jgi:competence protein ComEC
VLLGGYLALTGAGPATTRAAVMSVALIVCAVAAREPHRLAAVSLAALAMVAADRDAIADRGFQLSLAAVLGIATLGLDLVDLRRRALPLVPWTLDRPIWRGLLFSARSSLDGLAIGGAATLATLPLIAHHYGTANPWSPIASLIVAVPSTLALWLGLPCVALSAGFPDGPWHGWYAAWDMSLRALVAGVDACAALPGAVLDVPRPGPWCLALWPLAFLPLRTLAGLGARIVVVALLTALW